MREESVAMLIRDFTSSLATVIGDFNDRAERIATSDHGPAPVDAETPRAAAERLLGERRRRQRLFPAEIAHEPAWEMLLALFIAGIDGDVLNVKALVACAHAPVTTAQRWIERLHHLGLVERTSDPGDRRKLTIALTDAGSRAMGEYLSCL